MENRKQNKKEPWVGHRLYMRFSTSPEACFMHKTLQQLKQPVIFPWLEFTCVIENSCLVSLG